LAPVYLPHRENVYNVTTTINNPPKLHIADEKAKSKKNAAAMPSTSARYRYTPPSTFSRQQRSIMIDC
jgi:hypothetical protein